MRRTTGLVLAATLALSGCSAGAGEDRSAPATPEPTYDTPAAAPEPSPDPGRVDLAAARRTAYVIVMRKRYPDLLADVTDKNLVGIGKAVCGDLRDGDDEMLVTATLADGGFGEDAGYVLGASRAAFCPEMKP